VKSVRDDAIEWQGFVAPGVRTGLAPPYVVVEWRGVGRLIASGDGGDAHFAPEAGVDEGELAKFRATSLLACRRYLEGKVSLHGSAICLPSGGCIALVGDSGAGKSTTAMALVEARGAAFLADDVVPLDWVDEKPWVSPVADGLWLDAASLSGLGMTDDMAGRRANDKRRRTPRAHASAAAPLRAIVEAVFDEAATRPALEPLVGQDTFLVLSRVHVCYSMPHTISTVRDLALRARTAATVPLYRLRRRRSFADLPSSAELLADFVYERAAR
jgi:hypothetical protein